MAKKKTAKKKTAKKALPTKKPLKKSVKKSAPKKVKAKAIKPSAPSKKQVASLLPGTKAPSFTLLNEKGESVSLTSFLGKKVVIYFYPKDDTPGCTQESCDFKDNFARIKAKGAVIFGISRDSVKSHEKFKMKYDFPFSLLSDEDGSVCEAYGVWVEKSMYGRTYMGIERSTFIIDESGNLKKAYSKVKVSGHVDEVLGDLS